MSNSLDDHQFGHTCRICKGRFSTDEFYLGAALCDECYKMTQDDPEDDYEDAEFISPLDDWD